MTNKKLSVYLGLTITTILTLAFFQMAFIIPEGLLGAGNSIAERKDLIQNNLSFWQLVWINWMLAALGLLTFCIMMLPFITTSEWRILGISLVLEQE